jgi:type IV pilus assembly protein PilX
MDEARMYMTACKLTSSGPRSNRGVSLIIVLILMIIIGITASTAMRNASSEQRATNNQRMEATALQYAEAALRYCEAQMRISVPSARADASLQGTIPNLVQGPTTSGWTDPLSWTNTTGRASSTRTVVPNTAIKETANTDTVLPARNPECVVESVSGSSTIIITARGFSSDYEAHATTGATIRGAVVWLQSMI